MPVEQNDLRELMRKAIENPGEEFPQLSNERGGMLTAFNQLIEITDLLYKKQKDDTYPRVSDKGKTALINRYEKAITAAEKYQKGLQEISVQQDGRNQVANTLSELIQHTQDILEKDFNKLLSLRAQNKKFTLPEALENARTKKIDLSNQPIASKGGAISQRLRIKFKNTDGEMMDGYFTESTPAKTVEEELQDAYKKLEGKVAHIVDKDTLHTMVSRITEGLSKYGYGDMRNYANRAYEGGDDLNDNETYVSPEHIFDTLIDGNGTQPPIENKDKLFEGTGLAFELAEYLKEYATIKNKADFQESAGISSPKDIDKRNSAMTSVAALLDMGDLVAYSEPMELIGPDGKIIKGTFMQTAKGDDANASTGKNTFVYPNLVLTETGNVNKQLADLQILDYLCGNIDRHVGNMMYSFDLAHPTSHGFIPCTKIQGIDNDLSFGTLTHGQDNLPLISEMGFISEKTALILSNMTPAVLKTVLRNYNLSEDEMNAAQTRMEDLQNAVKNKTLKVVKENEWKDLYTFDYKNGYHERVKGFFRQGTNRLAVGIRKVADENYQRHFRDFYKIKNTLLKMNTLMQNADKDVWNGSSEFKKVKQACETMVKYYNDSIKEPDTKTFTKMRKALDSAIKNAKAYEEKKRAKNTLNDKEKRRLHAIQSFLDVSETELSVIGMVEKNCLEKEQADKWSEVSFVQMRKDYLETIAQNVRKYPEDSIARKKGVLAVRAMEDLIALAGENQVFDIDMQKKVSQKIATIFNYDKNLMIKTELGYGYGHGNKPKMGSSMDILSFLTDVYTHEQIKAPNMSRQVKEDINAEKIQQKQAAKREHSVTKEKSVPQAKIH